MPALFQATAEVEDFDRFRSAIEWVRASVSHPPGFVSMRVFRDAAEANRVTIVEEWVDAEAFMDSLRTQGPTAGPEFLARVGIPQEAFTSTLWTAAGVAAIDVDRSEAR